MFENISIGLDIASALSIIAAATAFIWNSILSKKNERNERKKEIIKTNIFKVIDRINEDSNSIFKETNGIARKIEDGNLIQDLNNWRDKILELPNSFKQLIPIEKVYGGNYEKLELEFKSELEEFILYFHSLVNPDKETNEKWDFYTIMNTPNNIAIKYITKLYKETENTFENS